jgi:hypothetical protein
MARDRPTRLNVTLDTQRQREIDETYAAGYAKHPQEEWVGELADGAGELTASEQVHNTGHPSTKSVSSFATGSLRVICLAC